MANLEEYNNNLRYARGLKHKKPPEQSNNLLQGVCLIK